MLKLPGLIQRVASGINDLSPLSGPVSSIVQQSNRDNLGTDRLGAPLAPLAKSTLKRRKGNGPPLAPQGDASRIAKTSVNVTQGDGELAVEMTWPAAPWLRYHVLGTRRMPKRDIVGIRPEAMEQVQGRLLNYWHNLFR